LCAAGARAIDKNLAHRACGNTDEVTPIVPDDPGIGQAQIRFVHQRGRLQRLAWPLIPHVAGGKPAEFPVHRLHGSVR
jgi:hypothetical protein